MIKIAMLSTGEEVLHGDILDSNAAWLSRCFYQEGFPLIKRSTVGDELTSLTTELVGLSLNYDVVIVNGGLGPTSDDITAEAAALASEQDLKLFEEWVETMKAMFVGSGRHMPASNIKQAMLPENASVIDNPVGTACGFSMKINGALFYFTPGVPREFKIMVEHKILPSLASQYPDSTGFKVSKMHTLGLSESGISDLLNNLQLPKGFELGYRSYIPFIEVKLFGPKDDEKTRLALLQIIYSHLGANVVSVDEEMLSNIGSLLLESKTMVSVAEVATGGYLSALFHGNQQAQSQLLQGWVLNNANNLDMAENDPLAAALALAAAIKDKTSSDVGLSVGKLDGSHVAIALSSKIGEWGQIVKLKRKYDREDQRKLIAYIALDMLRRLKENKPIFGDYSSLERVKELFVPPHRL